MKCARAKSASSGWLAAARMAESCVNDIDCTPPRKSSAERRIRTTSPNGRADEAGGGWPYDGDVMGTSVAGEFRGFVPRSHSCERHQNINQYTGTPGKYR